MGRSTAKSSSSTSRRFSPRPSRRAMSSSWTTSAATKARPPRHPQSQRRPPHLPAALQPRPQSHRTGLRQTQTPHPKSPAPGRRSHLAKGRQTHRPLLSRQVRQLPRQLPIWFRLSEPCSRSRVSDRVGALSARLRRPRQWSSTSQSAAGRWPASTNVKLIWRGPATPDAAIFQRIFRTLPSWSRVKIQRSDGSNFAARALNPLAG
jgi:hypothetical protein